MSKLTAAYIAGFIDGEGYVALEHHKGCGAALYRPVIKVGNTKKETIVWLYKSFGGSYTVDKRNNPKHKDCHTWVFSGKKLEPFIRKILPYLRQKRPQAELLLRRIKLYDKIGDESIKHIPHSGWNFKYKQKYIDEMISLYKEVRALNKRGV